MQPRCDSSSSARRVPRCTSIRIVYVATPQRHRPPSRTSLTLLCTPQFSTALDSFDSCFPVACASLLMCFPRPRVSLEPRTRPKSTREDERTSQRACVPLSRLLRPRSFSRQHARLGDFRRVLSAVSLRSAVAHIGQGTSGGKHTHRFLYGAQRRSGSGRARARDGGVAARGIGPRAGPNGCAQASPSRRVEGASPRRASWQSAPRCSKCQLAPVAAGPCTRSSRRQHRQPSGSGPSAPRVRAQSRWLHGACAAECIDARSVLWGPAIRVSALLRPSPSAGV